MSLRLAAVPHEVQSAMLSVRAGAESKNVKRKEDRDNKYFWGQHRLLFSIPKLQSLIVYKTLMPAKCKMSE